MRFVRKLTVLSAMLAAPGIALAQGDVKLRADLPAALAAAQPGQLVPVTVIMREQAEPFDIGQLRAMDKESRRESVTQTLRAVADATQADVLGVLERARQAGEADNVVSLWLVNAVAAEVTPAVARALADRPEVAYLNYDRPVSDEVRPVEPAADSDDAGGVLAAVECGTALMDAPAAWAAGYTGEGVVVGMIDTGTCITHPDIANQIWTNAGEIAGNGIDDDGNGFIDDIHGWSWRFNVSNNDISDYNSHGSHTAGTVAGDGTSGTQCGMAPDAQIMTLRYWNTINGGESSVWNALQYGVENGADVFSASLGWLHAWNPDRVTWRTVTEHTFATGAVVVFAAGNESTQYGIDSVRTPGDVPDMITVGAVDCNQNLAGFSSRGPVTWQNVFPYGDWPYPPGKLKPTISAPGVNTLSHSLCNGYTTKSGTSMATPHVSGAVALVLQANPSLDHYQVKQLLKDIALDLGTVGPDNSFGHGFVNAWDAVQAALAMSCAADFNGDGAVDTLDVLAFLNAWNAGDSSADVNGDGAVDSLDVLAFLNLWNTGC